MVNNCKIQNGENNVTDPKTHTSIADRQLKPLLNIAPSHSRCSQVLREHADSGHRPGGRNKTGGSSLGEPPHQGHRDLSEQLHWRHSLRRGRGGCAQQGQGRRDDFAEHSRRITQVSEFTALERFLGLHAYEERIEK